MLATPGALPVGPEWLYEVKWDGMRVLADVADGAVRLFSRTERDVTVNFPELAGLHELGPDLLLDGEVVLLERGIPSFAALSDRIHTVTEPRAGTLRPVTFMVFDLLRMYGVSLVDRTLADRRATVERLDVARVANVSLSPVYPDGAALLAVTRSRGMEGVVAKRRDSPYRPGRRSPSWIKTAHQHTQVCLVGGWRPEKGSARRIGALLLGLPDPDGLRYVGRVGSGLAGASAQRALVERLVEVSRPPFVERPPRPDSVGARWCDPVVVVEVAHLGWTEGGRLRQPVYRGVRDDLDPTQVLLES